VDFDLHSEAGLANWQRFLDEAADLVVKYGGTLSGEHGDGEARGALLEKMYGADLMAAQREFRAIWDPRQRMNPGKVLDPYPITANLRVGPSYQPQQVKGVFDYPEDGSFTKATLRCVGVGKCRHRDPKGAVMCPSYLGTNEEKHSTRGRARLLFEMLRGDSLIDGFASDEVEDALDLCLACKGCKKDCPVQVDMATYKSEFRSRYFEKKRRPRAAYTMGQIQRWAWLASTQPRLANIGTRVPLFSNVTKLAGGLSQHRRMPAFSSPPYRTWHRRRDKLNAGGERVLLWPDTFNNYFRSKTAIAATQVLERLGYQVDIPKRVLCCGRPLYDWGWIDQAKGLWRQTMRTLQQDIEAGTPIIGLEPACVSAFRDELPALFPNEPLAKKLSQQTRLLSEFLVDRDLTLPVSGEVPSSLMVQFHCHHHAVLEKSKEQQLLDTLPLKANVLQEGCCGMAGSFGFEAEKYDLSMKIGERIFRHIRAASPETAIIADGFSCREQIEQGTGRKTLHLAQLLEQATR
ncbi:MAG TPA: FAD-linked oxidase C-terminal domain-containing protein, partial [Rhizomicrobium sp.]